MVDADWIKLILQMAGLAGVGIGVVMAVRVNVAVIATKVDLNASSTAAAIAELRADIKPVAELGTRVALIDQRLAANEERVKELQHGDGMVLPMRGAYERGNRS